MFALPDSGVTVWPVRLIFDPPASPPAFQPQNGYYKQDDGKRRQPAVNPIAGGSSGGIPAFLQGFHSHT